jgi:hypothetical protein
MDEKNEIHFQEEYSLDEIGGRLKGIFTIGKFLFPSIFIMGIFLIGWGDLLNEFVYQLIILFIVLPLVTITAPLLIIFLGFVSTWRYPLQILSKDIQFPMRIIPSKILKIERTVSYNDITKIFPDMNGDLCEMNNLLYSKNISFVVKGYDFFPTIITQSEDNYLQIIEILQKKIGSRWDDIFLPNSPFSDCSIQVIGNMIHQGEENNRFFNHESISELKKWARNYQQFDSHYSFLLHGLCFIIFPLIFAGMTWQTYVDRGIMIASIWGGFWGLFFCAFYYWIFYQGTIFYMAENIEVVRTLKDAIEFEKNAKESVVPSELKLSDLYIDLKKFVE